MRPAQPQPGRVYLVGAGPGDPELLTVKASRLLREADGVLHDDLVSAEIVGLAGPQAIVVNVGKRCGRKGITQVEINRVMILFAKAGVNVVRLKSGDPLIFGRLNEEVDALDAAGVPYEVVPGITAGFAAAAALGVSLTDQAHQFAGLDIERAPRDRKPGFSAGGCLARSRACGRDADHLHARPGFGLAPRETSRRRRVTGNAVRGDFQRIDCSAARHAHHAGRPFEPGGHRSAGDPASRSFARARESQRAR